MNKSEKKSSKLIIKALGRQFSPYILSETGNWASHILEKDEKHLA